MTAELRRDLLGRGIATVLRAGTIAAVAAIAVGYAALLASGEDPGPRPLIHLVGDGGAQALLGLGLFGLTLIPVFALSVAAAGFRQRGERRRVATSLAVLVLLIASLAVAVLLTPAG